MGASTGFAIGSLTVIELTGADRNKILNNLCTQDLRSLQPGQVKETFILDVKGRTISHGIVACLDSKTLFISSPHQAQRLVPHIDRYIIREDALVTDASCNYQSYLFQPENLNAQQFCKETLGSLACKESLTAHPPEVWLHVPWLGDNTPLLLAPNTAANTAPSTPPNPSLQKLIESCQPSDCVQRQGWEHQRISNHWPWFGVDIDEKNLPQEIGIDSRAISFKKGCYLGQETVARLDALGQVQKQLAPVQLQTDAQWEFHRPCELFIDGKSIGSLTSAARSQHQTGSTIDWSAMAMLRRSVYEPGKQWNLDGNLKLFIGNK